MDWHCFLVHLTKNRIFDECVLIEPPRNITQRLYRCDKRFHYESVKELFDEVESFGLVFIDGLTAKAVSITAGKDVVDLGSMSSAPRRRTRRGGQSQNRYQRLNDEKKSAHINKVVDFIKDKCRSFRLTGLCGPGQIKHLVVDQLASSKYVTLAFTELKDAIDQWQPSPLSEDDEIKIERFQNDIDIDGGMAVYGHEQVLTAIQNHWLEYIFIESDTVDISLYIDDELMPPIIWLPRHHPLTRYGSVLGWRYWPDRASM